MWQAKEAQNSGIKVGLVCIGEGIGDSIICLKALFIAKNIFGARCVLFGTQTAQTLCANFDFIDAIEVVPDIKQGYILPQNKDKDSVQNLREVFNKHHLDYVVLGSPRATNIALLKSTNAKKILCALKFSSLFSLKCNTLPVYATKSYKTKCFEEILCLFVRLICPKTYDKHISSLDFSPLRLSTKQSHKDYIRDFLSPNIQQKHLIMINPFNISGQHSLSINAFLDIAMQMGKGIFTDCIALIATYPKVHNSFMEALNAYKKHRNTTLENLLIFKNNDDIYNLIELLKRTTCLISPSTGTAHLAANLGIPTVALYSKRDIDRWLLGGGGTYSKKLHKGTVCVFGAKSSLFTS